MSAFNPIYPKVVLKQTPDATKRRIHPLHVPSPAQSSSAQPSPAQPNHPTELSIVLLPTQPKCKAWHMAAFHVSKAVTQPIANKTLNPLKHPMCAKEKKLQNTEVLPIRCHFVLQQEGFTAEAVEELGISPAPDSKPTSDILHPGKGCSNQCPFRASLDKSTHWVQLHSSSYQQCFPPLHNANSFTSCN